MTGVRFSKERLPVSQKAGHRCAIPIDFVAISKCKQIPNVKHEELLKLLKLLFPLRTQSCFNEKSRKNPLDTLEQSIKTHSELKI